MCVSTTSAKLPTLGGSPQIVPGHRCQVHRSVLRASNRWQTCGQHSSANPPITSFISHVPRPGGLAQFPVAAPRQAMVSAMPATTSAGPPSPATGSPAMHAPCDPPVELAQWPGSYPVGGWGPVPAGTARCSSPPYFARTGSRGYVPKSSGGLLRTVSFDPATPSPLGR
jgi:hypothetical protein